MNERSLQPAHRVTTAHLGAAFPFQAEAGLGHRGIYVGRDVFGAAFVYDPFVLYGQEVVRSPNALVLGQLGSAKSALAKTMIWRSQVFGWRGIALDPKGENGPLCRALGVEPLRLERGGNVRLNPLDTRIGDPGRDPEHVRGERLEVLLAVLASSLGRRLTPEEKAACRMALTAADRHTGGEPTLGHVAEALLRPTTEAAQALATDRERLAERSREAGLELQRLCEGDLMGMFDGRTSTTVDFDAPLISIDMSALRQSDALGILMVCVASWVHSALTRAQGARWLMVIDEAWQIFRSLPIAEWLQSSSKLARQFGVAHWAIVHRLSDLSSAGDEGSRQVKLAEGFLRDTDTQIIYRQSIAEVENTRRWLDLTQAEAELIPHLPPGTALWRVGQRRFLVQHQLGPMEWPLVNTDAAMVA